MSPPESPITILKTKTGRNVLAIVKDLERYIFLFDDSPDRRRELLRTLGNFASDKSLNFGWYDAAVLSQKLRKMDKELRK